MGRRRRCDDPKFFLAFNFSPRRVGVAVGNTKSKQAQPLTTMSALDDAASPLSRRLVNAWQPDALVIGVPTHPDSAPHDNTAAPKHSHASCRAASGCRCTRSTSATPRSRRSARRGRCRCGCRGSDPRAVSEERRVSTLSLDAEALYAELLAGVRQVLRPDTALVGIWSGGAWLAERLQADLKRAGPCGLSRARCIATITRHAASPAAATRHGCRSRSGPPPPPPPGAVDRERQPCRVAAAGEAASPVVVAMQRARDHAARARALQVGLQALGQPRAAGPDADQRGVGLQQSHAAEQLGVQRFGVQSAACSCLALSDTARGSAPRPPHRHRSRPAPSPRPWCSARRPRAPAAGSARATGARSALARRVLSCGAPSGCVGTPTTSASGCHRPPAARWRRSAHRPAPTRW